MILTLIGTALSSILAGGATGLLGMIFQRGFDAWNAASKAKNDLAMLQEQNKQALAMKEADAKIMSLEWAGRLKVAEQEGKTAENVESIKGFNSTLFKEPDRYSNVSSLTPGQNWWLVILDFVRGSIRPLITAYLCGLTSYIYWDVHSKLSLEDLDNIQALQIWLQVVNTILYLTTTVILWWFGTRNQQSAPKPIRLVPTPVRSDSPPKK